MITKVLVALGGTLGAFGLYELLKLVYKEFNSPIKHLPGPKPTHWFYGNMRDIFRAEASVLHEQWVQEYGPTIKYKGLFGMSRLYTVDVKALNHFLTNSHIYQKPKQSRFALEMVVGPGVLVQEQDEHRRQRKIMNPAFGPPQVRELTSIFVNKSLELRDVWAKQANADPVKLDVIPWLNKVTLDIIGLAGFNYDFNSVASDEETELAAAFKTMFAAATRIRLVGILQAVHPIFRHLTDETGRAMKRAQATMNKIGEKLLQDAKKEIADSGTYEKGTQSRDLFSLLVRANTAKDIPANQRLDDLDVLAQVPTFLVAGHETTSTATTWALFALTQSPATQTRLREELLSVSTDNPTMDELNALPYLECVVRETLRVHCPVAATGNGLLPVVLQDAHSNYAVREAVQDDVVPLAVPFTDVNGAVHDTLQVKKGQTILIPILALNRDKAIWGEDATEFIAERWESGNISNSIPGVWGHMMTFLGGPRACIGYRFSLVEMKALLFTLVRAFEFELAVPIEDIGKKSTIVQRPILKSDPKAKHQLPLIVKPHVR
ncbi:unnamed protein product [Mycena citricolor]|uniref:Cytochrome P450 n=1 Tax=Mycena citricolor TaxID=2018698 RepID=A0AAD2Q1I1_9AGAR|nr:unnamed protein product [Mycena citricolor]